MRALLLLPDLDVGGAQRTIINLANTLPVEGISPTLVAIRGDGMARSWVDPGVALRVLDCRHSRSALWPLLRVIRDIRPDILLSTMIDANILAVLAGMFTPGLPVIVRETNSHRARGDLGWLRRRAAGWAYRRADAVVALSHGVAAELTDDYSLPEASVRTIGNPVDIDALRQRAAEARSRPARAGRTRPLFVAVGRLTRQKGFDILIDAFARLTRPADLVIVGEGPDRPALEQKIAACGLGDRVRLHGYAAEPMEVVANADIFVLSSRWEGFGHVIVEAMAAGLPVIATDCPHGPRDIIVDGVNGRLVRPGDPDALAAAMEACLADPDQARGMTPAAQQRASDFDRRVIAAGYAKLMRELV